MAIRSEGEVVEETVRIGELTRGVGGEPAGSECGRCLTAEVDAAGDFHGFVVRGDSELIDVEGAGGFVIPFFAGMTAAFPCKNAGVGIIDCWAWFPVVAGGACQDGFICRGGERLHTVHEFDGGLFECRGKADVAAPQGSGHGTRGIRTGRDAAKLPVRADIPLFQRDALSRHDIGGRVNEKVGPGRSVVGGGVALHAAAVEAAAGERGELRSIVVEALNLLCISSRAVFLSASPAAGGERAGGGIPLDNGESGAGGDRFCQVRESGFFCFCQFVSHLRIMEVSFPCKMVGRKRRQQEERQ